MLTGTVFNIQRFSVQDGPGIRSIVFLKGCPLRCAWCCNPESQGRGREIIYARRKCISCGRCLTACPTGAITDREGVKVIDRTVCDACGRCAETCYAGALEIVGERKTVAQVLEELEKDSDICRNSGGGVTLSGGEPMEQREFSAALLRECRERGIHTAMETCGLAPWEHFREILPLVDLFLFDVKHIDARRHAESTGQPNERILQNLGKIAGSGARVVARVPLIPGVNGDKATTEAMARFLAGAGVREAHLLPYHKLGVNKYAELGIEYSLSSAGTLPDAELDEIRARFERKGLVVTVYNHG